MTIIEIEKVLSAPRSLVWEKLSDFGNVHIFHPVVEKSALIGSRQCGLGAKRTCTFYDGKGHVEEEITGWHEGRSMTVALRDGTMPVRKAVFRFDLEEAGTNTTRLNLRGEFEMKWGVLGKIMGPVMMKPMMKKMLGDVLNGLDAHCRTGKRIGKNGIILGMHSSG
ncbi:MAG: SRPBCC family protein [Burkholderiales bacterium]|nr:SRPBCC family protein [Burkholderiales bacterium]